MNIYTMTEDFLDDFQEMFRKYGKVSVLPKSYREFRNLEIDLLIATGGEDVQPTWYGSKRKTYYNETRDAREMSLMENIIDGRINPKKVLGICRGLQMMNVSFGGRLIFDIGETYGQSHNITHGISWLEPNVFTSTIGWVNSLHHQAVDPKAVGRKFPYKILAIEPETKAVEAVIWADKFLGVQWHPEFLNGQSEYMKEFFAEKIVGWVNGNSIMDNPPPAKKTMQMLQDELREVAYSHTINWIPQPHNSTVEAANPLSDFWAVSPDIEQIQEEENEEESETTDDEGNTEGEW